MKIIESIVLFALVTFVLIISYDYAYAEESQTVEVLIKYRNGDVADYNGMKLLVYQDFDKSVFLEKQLESNPYFITVPENHKYKIEVYANGVYAGVEFIQVNTNSEEIEFRIPLSGGVKFDIFYEDGFTPIEGVRVVIKSNDNTEWKQGITNKQGETLRFWIQSTTLSEDYYIADIYLGDLFLKSHYPIKLQPGLSIDKKIIINMPEIVEDGLTLDLYKDATTKISTSDGEFTVTLTNIYSDESVSSKVNFRGQVYFTNLKSGMYVTKITPDENDSWPELNLQIIGSNNHFNIFKSQNEKIDVETPTNEIDVETPPNEIDVETPPNEIESCNCVAFRFDDVQDFWLNDVQIQLMNTFVENNIPLTIGIIADSFGDDSKMLEFVNQQNNKKNFEIASHGIGNTPFTEFSKDEQESKLQESVQKIKDELDVTTKVFIPPQNRFNEDTKQILIDNGFTHISSSLLHGDPPPFPLEGEKLYRFPEISTTGIFDPEKNVFTGVSHEETFSQTLDGLEKYGFAVITTHPQEFSTIINGTYVNIVNTQQISELEKLIEKIQQEGIAIVSIGQINIDSQTEIVPTWIKNNAGWWSEGEIDDDTFIQGIEYLIQENIITVSEKSQTDSNEQNIPSWIKNNAGWWSEGEIDDDTFIQGIEYLVKMGIIRY